MTSAAPEEHSAGSIIDDLVGQLSRRVLQPLIFAAAGDNVHPPIFKVAAPAPAGVTTTPMGREGLSGDEAADEATATEVASAASSASFRGTMGTHLEVLSPQSGAAFAETTVTPGGEVSDDEPVDEATATVTTPPAPSASSEAVYTHFGSARSTGTRARPTERGTPRLLPVRIDELDEHAAAPPSERSSSSDASSSIIYRPEDWPGHKPPKRPVLGRMLSSITGALDAAMDEVDFMLNGSH
jgi:hypothetical protein